MLSNNSDSQGNSHATSSFTPFPYWLKRPIAHPGKHNNVNHFIHCNGLHTVCIEAKCPNRGECYSKGIATFLIMGNVCTRNCSFCNVVHGHPESLNSEEPAKIINAAKKLNLKHVVITSVTRDDLSDGGADFYASIVYLMRKELPEVTIELLIPDLNGNWEALDTIIAAKPDVLNHNIETVERLYPFIRPQAQYNRSLSLLKRASSSGMLTKSGIMVGLGEQTDEVLHTMEALYAHGCSILTIGQYLRPSKEQVDVVEFIHPDKFAYLEKIGRSMGFKNVFSGPYVRSSYRAEEILNKTTE